MLNKFLNAKVYTVNSTRTIEYLVKCDLTVGYENIKINSEQKVERYFKNLK
jgi:hypothetical protein